MARALFFVFLMGVVTMLGFAGILVEHHDAGNQFHNSPRRLRSHILVYDPARVKREALPIRSELQPQVVPIAEMDPDLSRNLGEAGWYLGDKGDGSPVEPAAGRLAEMYREVDKTRGEFPKTVRLCWTGYISLSLAFLCASGLTLRRAARR